MKLFSISIFSLLLLIAISGCGSSLFVNESYTFAKKATITVAILPIGDTKNFSDTLFSFYFKDTTQHFSLISSEEMKNKLQANPRIIGIYHALLSKEYSDEERKNNPSMNAIVKDNKDFITLLLPADVVLVPVSFTTKEYTGYTFGQSIFRLYDAKSGALIYENSQSINVNVSGDDGMQYMSNALISMAYSDFKKEYLEKIGIIIPEAKTDTKASKTTKHR